MIFQFPNNIDYNYPDTEDKTIVGSFKTNSPYYSISTLDYDRAIDIIGNKQEYKHYRNVQKSSYKDVFKDGITPVSKIIVDGIEFEVVESLTDKEIKSIYPKTNFQKIVNELWDNNSFQWWNEKKTELKELQNYEREIIRSGGDGYSELMTEEIDQLSRECYKLLRKEYLNLSEKLINCYFNYSNSTVKDLSVIDGVRKYCFYVKGTMTREHINNYSMSQESFFFTNGIFFHKTIEKVVQNRLKLNFAKPMFFDRMIVMSKRNIGR